MFTDEYDYELDMQVKAEEAYEKGAQQKAVEAAIMLINEYNETPETAAQKVKVPLELVLEGLKQNVPVKSNLV